MTVQTLVPAVQRMSESGGLHSGCFGDEVVMKLLRLLVLRWLVIVVSRCDERSHGETWLQVELEEFDW